MASNPGIVERLASWYLSRSNTIANEANQTQQGDYTWTLIGLCILIVIGCLTIFGYGFQYSLGKAATYLSVVSVGLMAAGAAALSGGLLGFLFGVPHTVTEEARQTKIETAGNADEQQSRRGSTTYQPNTGLEQISDWLTKMLVGVGLIELKGISGKLKTVGGYIANGLGTGPQSEVFALTILIYFSVCGFVLGFLLARLYLVRWFREADAVQMLEQKVDRLAAQQQADAKALALINQQINRQPDDLPATDEEIARIIKETSQPVKALIFNLAEKAADDTKAANYDEKINAVIPIFEGLIASDRNDRYHRNYSELSYALQRKHPSDPHGAELEITKAIEIRNTLGKTGWLYYEFFRARCRIDQDEEFKKNLPSQDRAFKELVSEDLKKAYQQTDKWKDWCSPESPVRRWMTINKVDFAQS